LEHLQPEKAGESIKNRGKWAGRFGSDQFQDEAQGEQCFEYT
jgi:hypothetical protein